MLFERAALGSLFRPLPPVITESISEPDWQESCEPGRLWLLTAVRDGETIFELWHAFITRGPKLICAPRLTLDVDVTPTLALLQSSPVAQAREALNGITGLDTNWTAISAHPPNEKANQLALRVLETIFSARRNKPKVTVSAEGGVAIVYKENGRYVAIECLNRGSMWMLWFDSSGEPQSRRVLASQKAIVEAVEQMGLIIDNA